MTDNIFNMVEDLTASRFHGGGQSALKLLYGYARLATMNEGVLDAMFSDENEREHIRKIRNLLEVENSFDLELLKTCVAMMSDNEIQREDADGFSNEIAALNSPDGYSVEVLKLILSKNIPVLQLMKKGHTVDDYIRFSDENRPARDNDNRMPVPPPPMPGAREEEPEPEKKNDEERDAEKEADKSAETPAESLSKREKLSILVNRTGQLYQRLIAKVRGQNEAVRCFVQGYFQSEVLKDSEDDRKGPAATFLFAGPPGVGKTYLASLAADFLKMPFLRLDMSEYGSHDSVDRLTGIAPHFQGRQPGELTKFVKDNPRSIILLDEIEKAHEKVIYQFLQVLDGGMLEDNFNHEKSYFRDTILLFTTNVGKKLYEDRDRDLAHIPRPVVIKELEEEKDDYGITRFPQALVSRFASGNLIMFNHLKAHELECIIEDRFKDYSGKIMGEYGLNTVVDSKLPAVLLFSNSTMADARNISGQSVLLLKNEMYEAFRSVEHSEEILPDLESLEFKVDYRSGGDDIRKLFENDEVSHVLCVGSRKDYESLRTGERCILHITESSEEMLSVLEKEEIDYVLIDPVFGSGTRTYNLSIDDMGFTGIDCFKQLREKLPQMPVYLTLPEKLADHDRTVLREMGARDFIDISKTLEASDKLVRTGNIIYLQKMVSNLAGRGKILTYNTAQKLSEDGKKLEISFYDFRIKVAADAAENRMLLSDDERPKDRFSDVIGAADAKRELQFFVEYLKNPRSFMLNSVEPPKGILLYGPPGTGKTMLARAMAGEADASYFAVTGTSFTSKWAGESEDNIRRLFATARKFAPSIIFIDEIDSIGKQRTGDSMTEHREKELNTLIAEMEGFKQDPARPVFVIAATNYSISGKNGDPRVLDGALTRRFSKQIYVDLPNTKERLEFLNRQLGRLPNSEVSAGAIKTLADRSIGESLAMLRNVIDAASRNAGMQGVKINDEILLNTLEEQKFGEKKEWSREVALATAIHEAGHAYICTLGGEKPSFVTIVSRGHYGGYMAHENEEDKMDYTREELLWKIRTSLAGRASEIVFYNEEKGINTGASNDLEKATACALEMICRYGMSEGQLVSLPPDRMLSTNMADEVMVKVNDLLNRQMEYVLELVEKGRDKIQKLADHLMENNQATGEEIAELLK